MNVKTITEIREAKNALKDSLKSINAKDFVDAVYGQEQEYNANGVISGVDAIITDISALLRAPKQFHQASTYQERKLIKDTLVDIKSYIEQKHLEDVIQYIDKIKPILRSFLIRYSDERLNEFIDKTNLLQRKIQELTELQSSSESILVSISKASESANSMKEEITKTSDELNKHQNELEEQIADLDETRERVQSNFENDQSHSDEITNLLHEAKSHTEVIENFSDKVVDRESQLEQQTKKSHDFEITLATHLKQQDSYLQDAEKLISSAKQALEYKTAEGLSAAFTEERTKASSPKLMWLWIGSAAALLLCSIGLGVWLALGTDVSTGSILVRVSLLPILIGGAAFCANQYVKQKSLADDYAYKTVLAKSLVGFSEQMSSYDDEGEAQKLYISKVLSQILVDPQNKKAKKDSHADMELKEAISGLKDLPKVLDKMKKAVSDGE